MSYNITNTDYSKILKYYKLKIPKNKKTLKHVAENTLSKKLCSCIKKIDTFKNKKAFKKTESSAIAICTASIFNRKGLERRKFTCKNKMKTKFTKSVKKLKII